MRLHATRGAFPNHAAAHRLHTHARSPRSLCCSWATPFQRRPPPLLPHTHILLCARTQFVAFFDYWAWRHDYNNGVVSVRLGRPISKADKDWTKRQGSERHLVCIEDPFELSHDLGRTIDKHSVQVRPSRCAAWLRGSHPLAKTAHAGRCPTAPNGGAVQPGGHLETPMLKPDASAAACANRLHSPWPGAERVLMEPHTRS